MAEREETRPKEQTETTPPPVRRSSLSISYDEYEYLKAAIESDRELRSDKNASELLSTIGQSVAGSMPTDSHLVQLTDAQAKIIQEAIHRKSGRIRDKLEYVRSQVE